MSLKQVIGRREEMNILSQAINSGDPEFIVVYGRRRVGKTHLIRKFFEGSIYFEITGIHGASLKDQLDNFSQSLGRAIGLGIEPQRPSSWFEAFRQLEQLFESTVKARKASKRVIFFDELPWLNSSRSKFLSSFEHFWNHWGLRHFHRLMMIW